MKWIRLLGGLPLVILFAMTAVSGWATTSYCDSVSGNLVANCGFETGDFTGWTVTLGSPLSDLYISSEPSQPVNSGTYDATFTANSDSPTDVDTITQTLTTVPGDTYTFSFYLDVVALSGNGENIFQAYFNGIQELNLTSSSVIGSGFQLYSYSVTATSTSTVISFDGNDPIGYNDLDDVVVSAASTAPEPASLLLMGSALAVLGLARRQVLRHPCK